ncbi:hypothetical protein, conserved [Eimeria necatrix]|uniref:Uncharacterized protein n=1 Tax=Eimeria necatrix TaxID=51315 RepID=U6MDW1_9EIME|nr:hypothetical protein, conserved [Eimeria necatrix]CDJ62437.1 hypothetical protein, conserved [Eimeria necatrix]
MEEEAAGLEAGEYYGDTATKTAVISMFNRRTASEGCRQLGCMLRSDKIRRNFPSLKSRVEFLGYDAPSEVHLELNNGKKFRLLADGFSLQELHMRIDREQYQLHVEHIKEHAADAVADEDG